MTDVLAASLRTLLGALLLALVTPALAAPPDKPTEAEPPPPAPPGYDADAEAADAEADAGSRFIRVLRDENDAPLALQTAIVRYVPESGEAGVEVDLVSVVHIGDKSYYEQLNERFESYDVVLYELVAPKGTRIDPTTRRNGPLMMLVKSGLELDSQVELIDYSKENFLHADLSPQEMSEAMEKRGEDAVTLTLGILTDMLREHNKQQLRAEEAAAEAEENGEELPPQPEISLAELLFDPNAPLKLKRIMAEQFDVADPSTGLGPTLATLLIDDRNAACMKVFQKELAGGKTKIAIFYGAAHMPDFERRLEEEFGLKRAGADWLTAWNLE
ncbi:MAG: hypothetical protein ACREJB_03000 [Planctomycetaceae bacterium]